jgi:putative copper export protein
MSVLDWILIAIRWSHALGAVAWVGGGIFYSLVLRPALGRAPASTETSRAIGAEFRGLVNTAIGVLLVTGIILSASRLTADTVTIPYIAVLALKIALALYMFYIVRFLRQRAYPEETTGGNKWWSRLRDGLTSTTAVLIIGVIVFGLADVLSALFEESLTE